MEFLGGVSANERVVAYYTKHGFETMIESKSEPKRMTKEITPFTLQTRRNRKTRKRTYPRNAKHYQPLTATMMPNNLGTRKSERFL